MENPRAGEQQHNRGGAATVMEQAYDNARAKPQARSSEPRP